MPSPKAFSCLRSLCEIMAEVGGTDLWTSSALDALKKTTTDHIFALERKAWYMENDFDEAYLGMALGFETRDEGEISPEVQKQMRGAQEYWTRTKLLFGMLA
jgi:hypothetical protein